MINYAHKVNLKGVFKEFICSHCGKTIVMPIGFHIKDYTYRLKAPKSNAERKNGKYLMALSISAAGHAIRKAKQPSLTAERDCRKKTGTG